MAVLDKYSEDLNNKHMSSGLLEVRYLDHTVFRCPISATTGQKNSVFQTS